MMNSAYIIIRYYSDHYGTRFKIFSDDRTKEYDVWEYGGNREWVHIQRFTKFKWAYEFVKECLDNEN